jgi:arabinosyltransferase
MSARNYSLTVRKTDTFFYWYQERQSTVRLVVDRRAYESVARKNNVPVAGSPTDSVNGKRAWTSDELRSATVLEPGFTTGELIAALKATPWNHTQTATDAPILEFDFLGGDGSFCGFGDGDDGGGKKKSAAERNREFDTSTARALSGDQYYCFTESWRDMGSPKSGGDEPYEPQVVKRHCGEMEPEFRARGNVHPGTVEHILKQNPTCSCEWGFGAPRPLAEIANDPNVCRKRGGEPGTREV